MAETGAGSGGRVAQLARTLNVLPACSREEFAFARAMWHRLAPCGDGPGTVLTPAEAFELARLTCSVPREPASRG